MSWHRLCLKRYGFLHRVKPSLSGIDSQGNHRFGNMPWALMTSKRIPRKRTSLGRGPVCSICKHENRVLIEQTRCAGASLDSISAKYSISRDALHRHMKNHVSEDQRASYLAGVPLRELAKRATAEGLSVLEYFGLIRATLMTEFQLAANVHDKNAVATLAGRLIELLREIGRITGEIMRSPGVQNVTNTVNFINSPDFLNLQQMLIRRLAGHPEALAAVIEGLRELESRSAPHQAPPLTIEHQEPAHA
jgi:hypothetical protein